MVQSAFFEKLGAPFRNVRWSWGAVRSSDGTVFLRVWNDHFRLVDGKRYVRITFGNKSKNLGNNERLCHVSQIESGARAMLVVCEARDPNAKKRTVKRMETDFVYVGGPTRGIEGDRWIEVVGQVPASEAATASSR